mmetsp:Transcript_18300/g.44065  ORF Transcript_18300/g.44065 Transcript_18300/m.44065 type:complete len:264 (-) Transcript_18300:1022-1813(-)
MRLLRAQVHTPERRGPRAIVGQHSRDAGRAGRPAPKTEACVHELPTAAARCPGAACLSRRATADPGVLLAMPSRHRPRHGGRVAGADALAARRLRVPPTQPTLVPRLPDRDVEREAEEHPHRALRRAWGPGRAVLGQRRGDRDQDERCKGPCGASGQGVDFIRRDNRVCCAERLQVHGAGSVDSRSGRASSDLLGWKRARGRRQDVFCHVLPSSLSPSREPQRGRVWRRPGQGLWRWKVGCREGTAGARTACGWTIAEADRAS